MSSMTEEELDQIPEELIQKFGSKAIKILDV